MSSILIVGYGSHTKRRILPALDSINDLDNTILPEIVVVATKPRQEG